MPAPAPVAAPDPAPAPVPAPPPAAVATPAPAPEPAPVAEAAPETVVAAVAPSAPGEPLLIPFAPGGAELSSEMEDPLRKLAGSLAADEGLRLQLKAYASAERSVASAARRLSLSRALAVRSFLIDAGVNSTRIDVRALGAKYESGPPDRVDVITVR